VFKTLSSVALSLALIGGTAGLYGKSTSQPAQTHTATHLSVSGPDLVSPSPEFEAFAKSKGVDLSKHAKELESIGEQKGQPFTQPGDSHVTYQPTNSEIPMLVLLVKFKDEQPLGTPDFRVPANYFNDLIFGDTYDPYQLDEFKQYDGPDVPKHNTMQNVYKESSYGKVTLTTDDPLTAWVTLPHNADYYLSQDIQYNAYGFSSMGDFMVDLLAAADDQVDFSKYAVDDGSGNKVVPNVFVIHAGSGAEWSGDPLQFWSHSWDIQSALYYDHTNTTTDVDQFMAENAAKWTKDGVVVSHYTLEPELGGNVSGYDDSTGNYSSDNVTGPYPTQVGVFAHEFGHALGLPDLYDVDYTSEGDGNFSIMAGGSWMSYPKGYAYLGNSPTNFDPFSKMFLGWAEPMVITPQDGEKTLTLPPVNEAGPNNGFVKMEVPGSNGTEYYLFENAQQVGFNKGLSRMGANAHGLLAWHVDESKLSEWQTEGSNLVNSTESYGYKLYNTSSPLAHYGLSVVQKDGQFDLEKGINRGDAGDFFQTGDVLKSNGANVYSGSFYFYSGYSAQGLSGINVKNIKENPDGSLTATFFYQNDK
jgi:immune inhibitor A